MRPLPGSGATAAGASGEINKSGRNDLVTAAVRANECGKGAIAAAGRRRKRKTRMRGRRIRVKKGVAPITVIQRPTTDEEAAGFRCAQATPAGTKSPLKGPCKKLLFGGSRPR